MTEAQEIARSLIAKHGTPPATCYDDAARWLRAVWPDVDEWLGAQMRANVAEAVLHDASRKA